MQLSSYRTTHALAVSPLLFLAIVNDATADGFKFIAALVDQMRRYLFCCHTEGSGNASAFAKIEQVFENRCTGWGGGVTPRGLSKSDAAEYCGCATLEAFDDWVRKGIIPGAIPGTHRWDRKAIDAALDRASGLI